jgi:hypothetical protein
MPSYFSDWAVLAKIKSTKNIPSIYKLWKQKCLKPYYESLDLDSIKDGELLVQLIVSGKIRGPWKESVG